MDLALLDPNIVSYALKGHTLAPLYAELTRGRPTAVCFMTVAELYEGAYRREWDEKRLRKMETVIGWHTVIPYSQSLAQTWARIRTERRLQPIAVDDAWIAAAALDLGCPLVTHNPGDFRSIDGLNILTLE